MSSTLGILFVTGPLLALIWIALPHQPVASVPTLIGVGLVSMAVGWWLLAGASSPRPLWLLHLFIVAAVAGVSVVIIFSGGQRTGFVLFYLYVAPYSWALFSARAAALHTAFTASVALGVLVFQQAQYTTQPVTEVFGRWLLFAGCLLSFGWLIRSLTANLRRSAEALAGQAAEVQARQAAVHRAMAEFAQRALEGDDLDVQLLDSIDTVAEVLGAPVAIILERDGEGLLRMSASVGMLPALAPGEEIHDSGGLTDYVIATGRPVVIDNMRTESRFVVHQALLDDGLLSGVVAPIQRGGTIVGFLQAFSRNTGRFDAADALTLTAFAATLSQVVRRHAVDDEMVHRALHDPLTGLPNRTLFADRLSHAVAQRPLHDGQLAVIFADIDRFKVINDTYGHPTGDELLVALAPRLAAGMRDGDTLARFGGDEFVFLLEGVNTTDDALDAAHRFAAAAADVPFILPSGLVTHVSLSMGVSMSRGRPDCVATMIDEADAGMYLAKAAGGRGVRLFDARDERVKRDRRQLEPHLREALHTGELTVVYQPIVDVETSVPVGFEALARWTHPERGQVSPQEFIPLAEEAGLIDELEELVLRTASADVAAWQRLTGRPLLVSVNVSARHLAHPTFTETTLAIFANSDLLPATLCMEITESALILDNAGASATLSALHNAGVRISLDDFGTGYSSLAHLREFPIDTVKIDMSFVANLIDNDDDAAIVEGVIVMARRMALTAVAEGVENVAVHTRLRELGCPLAQGYLWSVPMPASEIGAYLEAALPVQV